jgi:hypothetical protein
MAESSESPFPVDVTAVLLEDSDRVRRYLRRYFSPDDEVGYSGRFFEQFVERSDPYGFTPWDLVAVSSLSVDIPPRVAAAILLPGPVRDRLNNLLRVIPDQFAELTAVAPSAIDDRSPLAELYRLVRDLEGLGRTKTSKLLAAKRPGLVPIRDSVVERLLQAGDRWWFPMQHLAQDPRLRALIDDASGDSVPANVSYLRRLDVVLWSYGSEHT